MKAKMEQFPATNANPVLNVANDGVILYSNEASEPLLHEWGVRVRERLPSRIVDLVQRVISLDNPEKIEVKVGKKVYLVVFHPIPKEQYVNVSGFDITEDITERKRAEDELRESEARYRDLFESMQEPVSVQRYVLDDHGEIVDWVFVDANPASFRDNGLTREEQVGKSFIELFGAEAIKPYLPAAGEMRRRNAPITMESEFAPLGQHYQCIFAPFTGDLFIVSSININDIKRDITERKREEEHERFVRDLLNEIASMSSSKEILHRTCQALGEYLRVGNVHMADMDEETDTARAYQGFTDQTVPPLEGEWPNVSSFWHPEMTAAFRNGMTVVVRNAQHHPWTIAEKYAPTGVAAFVTAPFIEEGVWRHFISVISAEPRDWREDEIRVAERVTRGVFPHLQRARASEELRASELMYRSLSNTLEEKVRERTEELEKAYKFLQEIEIVRKQEIHHRIKNNLQVISSLLDLQAEKFRGKKNIEDSHVLESFKESQDRVISMALIHEGLHRGGKLDTLNFSTYIHELADNLFISYRLGNEGTSLNMDIEEDIFFDMDTAIPLGIIVNELISNSLKYAFFDRDNGEITIRLYRQNGECGIEDSKSTTFTLSVVDNGVGIPEDLDMEDLDSLGLQLVTTLIDQLEGELELKNNKGTEFTIRFTFPESNNPKLAKHSLQLTDND